jgi:hypothetical protein
VVPSLSSEIAHIRPYLAKTHHKKDPEFKPQYSKQINK